MDKRIEKIKKFRQFLLSQISDLTDEQLNRIPQGYNNNIIWNLAHLICAQQSICYMRANLPITIDDKYFAPYTTNTKPTGFIDGAEIERIKNLLIDSIDEFQRDFDNSIFEEYSPSPNILKVYGIELTTIGDALEFILYHEGFHSGYIISLKRLVS